jgi:hypothetical protein
MQVNISPEYLIGVYATIAINRYIAFFTKGITDTFVSCDLPSPVFNLLYQIIQINFSIDIIYI